MKIFDPTAAAMASMDRRVTELLAIQARFVERRAGLRRNDLGDLGFRLFWIPYLSELETPIDRLTKKWAEAHRVEF